MRQPINQPAHQLPSERTSQRSLAYGPGSMRRVGEWWHTTGLGNEAHAEDSHSQQLVRLAGDFTYMGKKMNHDVIEMAGVQQASALAVAAPATPADIVLYAMKNGGSIAEIREFMQLQREWEADQARKAYVADMAAFKLDPPEIVKDKLVGYKNKDGSVTGYTHATLGNVTGAIIEGLARHGFSHRWDTEQKGADIIVTCILTHKLGHSESTTLNAAKDDSGKKNSIQQMASTITYLQRYTLLGATGLATRDQDDDGATAELDTTLADNWIARVKAAPTDADVVKVWEVGIEPIQKSGDKHAYTEFKNAVAERRSELAAKAAKK
jgi:hypothetical protein